MIGKLLNEGNFTEAEKLCTELAHTSEDMLLVRTMIAVATGTISPSGLPGEVAEIIARKLGSVPSQSILERLESLAKCAVFARECCDRILVFSRVSNAHSPFFYMDTELYTSIGWSIILPRLRRYDIERPLRRPSLLTY
jgi:hypothetical protein